MGIQVYDHGIFNFFWESFKEVSDQESDVCVRTETCAPIATAVVEATANVNDPPSLQR